MRCMCRYNMADGLKFAWQKGSMWMPNDAFWASLMISNVPNGIGSVRQNTGNETVELEHLGRLGQIWGMKMPANKDKKEFEIEVTDVNGKSYGTYVVAFNCGGECSDFTDTTSARK
jgi:hypothetical protein